MNDESMVSSVEHDGKKYEIKYYTKPESLMAEPKEEYWGMLDQIPKELAQKLYIDLDGSKHHGARFIVIRSVTTQNV